MQPAAHGGDVGYAITPCPGANMEDRIEKLERDLRRMKLYATLLTLVIGLGALAAFRQVEQDSQVLRARGIVIEDARGRDRILIGAPIPASKSRMRTDLARVEQSWATRYPNPKQYMEYYRGYRHTVHGILVLDENGHDRLAVGDSVPDPNIGKRIGPGTGVTINNAQGFERSGYSLLTVQGKDRVVLGLDDDEGEGIALSLVDEGHVGMMMRTKAGRVFLGSAPGGHPLTGMPEAFHGLLLKENDETRAITARSSRAP
jgi:hypothetical protein